MKIVIAIDSFKGSLSSIQAGRAAEQGIRRVFPDAVVKVLPVADGGEGTVDALCEGLGGVKRTVTATDPLERKIKCEYGIIEKSKTAIIEMSAAAGITLITAEERSPLDTTTYGVGEMIADAIALGCRNFIVGIGGSATNDGGTGMLSALGFEFLGENGEKIPLGAKGLEKLYEIRNGQVLPALSECDFKIACDVTNPLCGENGCSAVYGPQKGADREMIEKMDSWLEKYAVLSRKVNPVSDSEYPGTGAAGGMGFAFRTFLGGSLVGGVKLILDATGIESHIKDCDIVITGEGRLDSQTVMGKAPSGVAAVAKKHGKPVIAFSGCVSEDAGVCNGEGIDAFFPILRSVVPLDEALDAENAFNNMADTAEQVFRLIGSIKNM